MQKKDINDFSNKNLQKKQLTKLNKKEQNLNFNINNIYKDFIFWLKGLIEDDPVPYEIKSLVFYIDKNYEIGFSGIEEENVKKIDKFFYNPLESEYFYCNELYLYIFSSKNKEQKSLSILNNLLKKLKKEEYFSRFNYFYGLLFNNAKKVEE